MSDQAVHHKERYFSTFELILLALMAALIVVAKIALRLPLQLSAGADAASDTVQLRLTDPALAARWLSEL